MSADDDFEVVSRSKHASFAVSSSNHGRRYWMPNGLVSNCLLCKQAFSFTVRKHHCRQCGLIFCDSCSSKQLVLKDYSKKSPVRVCDTCYAQLTLQTRMQQRRAPVIGAAVAEGGGDGGVTTVGGDGHGPLMVTGPLLGRGGDLPSRASSVSVSSSGTASPTSQVGARRHSAFDPSSMVPVRFIGDSDGGGSHPYGAGAALLEMHHVRAVSGEEEVFVIDNVVLYVGDEDSIAATTARVDPFSIETPDAYVRPIAQTLGFADKGGEALHENLVELEQTATQFLSPHPVQLACCGSLVATNFRVVFVPKLSPDSVGFPPVDVPLATIDKTEVLEFDSEDMRVAKLACKDFRTVYWAFPGQLEQQAFFQLSKFSEYLSYYMRPGSVEDLFAFKRLRSADEATVEVLQAAWKTYNFTLCMERLSIPDENWKIVNWNRSHNLCPTYPTQLTVPAVVSEAWLRDVSSFRSKARVPALTWRLPGTRTVLIRSAQPLVGLMGTRSLADEAYMDAVVAASDSPFLVIFDARPSVNAKAQTAMGAGYESPQYYETGAADSRVTREQLSQHPGLVRSTSGGDLVLSEGAKDVLEYMASQPGHVKRCILEFARIENIHVMRKSYRGVAKLCARTLEKGKVGDWWGQLNDTGWMQHLATIMSGAVRMASYLQHGVSVLCHCSDGWDRTAQLVSLAQVLLDPYFRTIEGFEVLVEKDWCAFGHKFLDRTGHVDHQQTGGGSNETSPVFSQFIDLVWQLQHQFPTAFEFGEGFLVHILDALYSCEYGNFITNNNRSHLRYTLAQRTYSLWQPSTATMPDSWRNPHYKPPLDMNKPAMLVPDVPRLTFWESYYLRWAKQMQSVAYSGASRRPSLASPSSGHYITGASMSAARSRRRGSVYPSAKESMNLLAASIESERRAQAVLACRAIVDGIVAKAAFVAATRNLERRLAQAEAGLAMATVQKGVAEHICYDVGFQKGKEHVLALHMNLAPQVEAESDDWMAVHEPHVHPTARIVHQAGLDASVRDGYADASSWVPDDAVSECQDCQRAFSFLVRKHHCRRCGRVFCNRCTTKNEQNKRVCLKCASG